MADTIFEPGLFWMLVSSSVTFAASKIWRILLSFWLTLCQFWIHAALNLTTCFPPAVFACLGFLSPANRGALMTCAVVLWVLLGTPAGYVAARYYKCKYAAEDWPLISDPRFIRAVCSSLDLISVRGALYTNRQAYTPLLLFCFSCSTARAEYKERLLFCLLWYQS